MSGQLFATKLHVPVLRSNAVARPRLVRRLEQGLADGRSLTLVSGPAGYGKTTLVGEWLAGQAQAVAWLSLDPADDDLPRFLDYAMAALRVAGTLLPHDLDNDVVGSGEPTEYRAMALTNALTAMEARVILALDDYQLITDVAIHEFMRCLVERQPPQLHLVIITRQDPPLSLPRLRARNRLTEIRQSDLRFTLQESAAFLTRTMGVQLGAAEIASLEERTEGWITGLQMAGLALQSALTAGRDATPTILRFSGRHEFILDYLMDEVVGRQTERVQAFLLRTSVLERMCGPLCDALLSSPEALPSSGQAMLEALEEAHLFLVPLDSERRWYRYHHLFADLLRARLKLLAPDQVASLHRRAAQWHAEQGHTPDAVHHALQARDFVRAADLVEASLRQVATWSSGDVGMLIRWLERLPGEIVDARPWLRLHASRLLYAAGRREETERILIELEASLADEPTNLPQAPSPVHDRDVLLGLVTADRAGYAAVAGDVLLARSFAERALRAIPGEGMASEVARLRAITILGLISYRVGDIASAERYFEQAIADALSAKVRFAAVGAATNLVDVHLIGGHLRDALAASARAIALADEGDQPIPIGGIARVERGRVLYEVDQLAEAESSVVEGLGQIQRGGLGDSFGNGHSVLALIRQALGDSQGASNAIAKAVQMARRSRMPRLVTLAQAYGARIALMQGDLYSASRWAREYASSPPGEYLRVFEDLALARVLLAEQRGEATLALLDRALTSAEADGRMGHAIEILALRALALGQTGEIEPALRSLTSALALAQPEGFLRVFVDEGAPMAALLGRVTATAGPLLAYVRRLRAALGGEARAHVGVTGELIEPLTERELTVLSLLAQGLSNREIARALFLSPNTVRAHTYNIYGKLDVHSRGQAVARGRELGLIAE